MTRQKLDTGQDREGEQVAPENVFSCYIIGADTLPIRCAEWLLAQGHNVAGLISTDPKIRGWAQDRNIDHLSYNGSFDILATFLQQQPFDYFFSISNPYILPPAIFELPTQCTLNYHNGPLPKYAGSHATTWAIINQEKRHGITWHLVSEGIDKGDILAQRFFDIADDDTSITLNVKCYDAAFDAFKELIPQLSRCQIHPVKQDLNQRTFYRHSKRPDAGCTILWDRPAQAIHVMVRSLDFGGYMNPLGLPKVLIGQEFRVVKRIRSLSTASNLPPGTLVDVTPDALMISTTSHDLAIEELQTLDGAPCPIRDVISQFALQVNTPLPQIAMPLVEKLTTFNTNIARHEPFWLEKLQQVEPLTILDVTQRPVPPDCSQRKVLSAPISSELVSILMRQEWSVEECLLTSLSLYLARLRGIETFDLGFMGAALRHVFAEPLFLGLYAPFVPLFVNLTRVASFTDAMSMIGTEVASIITHKTFTRDIIARSPDLRRTQPLGANLRWPVAVAIMPADIQTASYPAFNDSEFLIVIKIDEQHQTVVLDWVYQPEQVDQASISIRQQQFQTFLNGIAIDPETPIAQLPLLSDAERQQLLVTWNDTAVPRDPALCLHHLFEAQVERTPTAVAVTAGSQQLTYHELNQQANQLAHHLKKQGVEPETLIGICLERSLAMVIGLMGILKAGGGYVPLDPTYPEDRLAFIVEDAKVSILLTQTKLLRRLPPTQAQIIDLEADGSHIFQESPHNLTSMVQGDNVAYVMYTSGSTGRPKGVVVLHRGVCNYLLWRNSYFPLHAFDRVLQKTSFSFVDSVWELFEPLMVGAQLIMAEPDRHYDLAYLVNFISNQKITAADFIPSLLQLFLEEPEVGRCTSLRRVTTGSETVTVDLQSQFFFSLQASLYNLYGPTEASIASTCWTCQPGHDQRSVPIGRPIANTQIYLLDKHLQPVPIGLPGEVHIGGLGLARGYLNRPVLTAEKFISNPFSDDPEARLYKTGDLARYLPDGNLEFLGRVDHQVKIRGYRIELGEIEACLRQHGAVHQAVALVREDRPSEKRLVAYVVPRAQQGVEMSDLRHYLQQKLPDYMVPSTFIHLDELPMTPNGKVDRRALPVPDAARPELAKAYVAPEGSVEVRLAALWQDVLGLEKVGVHDNFFELGGHSLIAARLFSKMEREFGVHLPLATLFRAPSIVQIAEVIKQKDAPHTWSSLVPIRTSGTRPPFYFVHAHEGIVVGYYKLAQYLGDDQPFYGIQGHGLNGIINPAIQRFEDLAAAYIEDIRQVQMQGPYYLGGWCYGGNLAFEMAQQLQAQGEEVALLVMIQSDTHGYPQYPAHRGGWQRACYQAMSRLHMEVARVAETRPDARMAHVMERCKRLTTVFRVRVEQGARKALENLNINIASSQVMRFEELGTKHIGLYRQYEFKPYHGDVTLFKAEKQPMGIVPDPTLGWGQIIKGALDLHEIPGHHFGVLSEPRVQITAAKLKTVLRKAQQRSLVS